MSFSFMSSLNKPHLVTAAGAAIAASFPFIPTAAIPLGVLQLANVLAFAVNVGAVSVPGRIDGQQDEKMRGGEINPRHESAALLDDDRAMPSPSALRERTLARPAGWAFAIWAPIYLGEATFCVAQFVDGANLAASLPQATAPFVAANLLQSLWCASYRTSYDQGWHKYVSCAMLGGTAYALSFIPASESLFYIPLVMHFGWTSAATLVNLNGSLSATRSIPDSAIVAVAHSSAVVAGALGICLTAFETSTPVYGLTLAWALAGVANGIKVEEHGNDWSDALKTGAKVEKALCLTGSALCAAAAAFIYLN